ncbi:hypothetical protein ACRHK7_06585 [Weissella tructae]|uniref:hypothetical protein n=1 Tax=Weissella tructae TaxID=887702 RepID=UPI003D92F7B4
MSEIVEYKFFGLEHLLILPESDQFIVTLIDPQGAEITCQANIWTLPAELPDMLGAMFVESITPVENGYDVVNFYKSNHSFDGQAKIVQLWYEWRERLRGTATIGLAKIDDGEFEYGNV